MLKTLLQDTLDSIESLFQFYNSQEKMIKDSVSEEIKKYAVGASIDSYFRLSLCDSDEIKEQLEFEKLEQYVLKFIKNVRVEDRGETSLFRYELVDEEFLDAHKIEKDVKLSAKKYKQYQDMPKLNSNNTLVMLLVRFEEFISKLLAELYTQYPQKYLNNKDIKYSEIIECGIDEIRDYILRREIDAVMRDSYISWFKILESHGMRFDSCSQCMTDLKELYARRNIIIHNSGRINATYRKQVPSCNENDGVELVSDKEYIIGAFSNIKTIIFTIMIESINVFKENEQKTLEEFFLILFDELCKKNYALCANVFTRLSNNRSIDEVTRHMSRVNTWISLIELGQKDSIIESIERFDVSALDKSFQVAKYILLEEYDLAIPVMEQILVHDDLNATAIETWPLFLHFRESEQYIQFRHDHAEFFNVESLDVDDNSSYDCTREEIMSDQISVSDDVCSSTDEIEPQMCVVS